MKLTHFAAANWCNFAHIEFDMSSRVFIVGPNSSGKPNLLGALRFLSDIARYGLAAATEDLGGLDRYVHSGADSASFVATFDDAGSSVEYVLKLQRSASDGEGLMREDGPTRHQRFCRRILSPATLAGVFFLYEKRSSLMTGMSSRERMTGNQNSGRSSQVSATSTRTLRRCSSGLIATTLITGPASFNTQADSRTSS